MVHCMWAKETPSCARSLLLVMAIAVAATVSSGQAQHPAAKNTAAVGHPILAAPRVRVVPATRPVLASAPAVARVAGIRPSFAGRWLYGPSAAKTESIGLLPAETSFGWAFGGPTFVRPFFFGWFAGGFGYPGSVSQVGGLPLGFGLWPACDSAETHGVFWTVGPCFGSGVQEATPVAAQAQTYILPLMFFEAPRTGEPGTQQNAGPLAAAPTMLLYLSDGRTIPAADWWVTEGRLHYVTDTGTNGILDLPQLDLEQTIKQNQKRGLEFHLRFTPPSERP